MVDIAKLPMTNLWAAGGDKTEPSAAKINQGWVVEAVPRQTWNWFENRQDVNIAYLLQKGIPEWDAGTEYQTQKSWVQAGGIVYKCILTNTNQDPTAANSTYWKKAFSEASAATDALATLVPAAGRLPYFTGVNTAALTGLTAFARSLLDDPDAATARATLDAQQANVNLNSLAGVTAATNGLPYFTSTTTMGIATLSAFGRTLIALTDAAAARAALELGNSATLNVGTTAGTVAAGDDSRITQAASDAANALSVANTANTTANTANTRTTTNITEGTNLYFTETRVRNTPLTGLTFPAGVIAATDTVLVGLGKAQLQLNARPTGADMARVANDTNRNSVFSYRNRNLIENASFKIRQRAGLTSVTTNSTIKQYWIDRWEALVNTTASITQYPAVTNPWGAQWNMTINGAVQQFVAVEELEVGTYTLSWCGTAPVFVYGTNAQNLVASGTTTGGYGFVTFTHNPLNDGGMMIRFLSGTVTRPKLERGSIATPFEPENPSTDLALCQRYFQRFFGLGFNMQQQSPGEYGSARIHFHVQMRAIPRIVTSANPVYSNVTSWGFDSAQVGNVRSLWRGGPVAGGVAGDFQTGDFLQVDCEPT